MASKWTWDKLDRNGARLNPRVRGNNYPDTPRFELGTVVPYKGTRTCFISLRAWGVTQPGLHNVIMLFEDVDVLSELPDNNKAYLRDYFELKYKGETYYVKKFDKYRNPINVRCDCKDFFMRFAWYNFYNGHCLYGPAPKPYRRKTTWYPPQNPMKYPGICKHLHNAWEVLRNSGLTVN